MTFAHTDASWSLQSMKMDFMAPFFVMAGHSMSKTGVTPLCPGHPRLACRNKKDVAPRVKPGGDAGCVVTFEMEALPRHDRLRRQRRLAPVYADKARAFLEPGLRRRVAPQRLP